jgi:ligand-binding SRPBCC domain-containing protein
MRYFEHDILIRRPRQWVYAHIAQPKNLMELQPLLTAVEPLKESIDADGIITRPFYSVETFRLGRLPIYNNRIYVTGKLTKPFDEMEYLVKSFPNIRIHFLYLFQDENTATRLTQKVHILQVNPLLESFVFKEALRVQQIVLARLKERLEAESPT